MPRKPPPPPGSPRFPKSVVRVLAIGAEKRGGFFFPFRPCASRVCREKKERAYCVVVLGSGRGGVFASCLQPPPPFASAPRRKRSEGTGVPGVYVSLTEPRAGVRRHRAVSRICGQGLEPRLGGRERAGERTRRRGDRSGGREGVGRGGEGSVARGPRRRSVRRTKG